MHFVFVFFFACLRVASHRGGETTCTHARFYHGAKSIYCEPEHGVFLATAALLCDARRDVESASAFACQAGLSLHNSVEHAVATEADDKLRRTKLELCYPYARMDGPRGRGMRQEVRKYQGRMAGRDEAVGDAKPPPTLPSIDIIRSAC
jgi:hypothetical protein